MALTLTRNNVLARFGGGGYHSGASSLIHSATSALRHELNPAMRTGAISLSAFTFGVLQGKYQKQGGLTLAGLPVDMLSGAAFHVVALFGFARSYAPLLHAFGDGALATFLSTTGYRVGERWASGSKGFIPAMMGAFVGEDKPVSGGSSIADEELRKLARG
jgi:hypothetical protein